MIEACAHIDETGHGYTYRFSEPHLFHKEIEERRAWLKANMTGRCVIQRAELSSRQTFYFSRYDDAFAFAMRFSGTGSQRERRFVATHIG